MTKMLVLVIVVAACKKSGDTPPVGKELGSAESTASAGSAEAHNAEPPKAVPKPMSTPVKMTAEELKPTCEKIFTAEVVAKSHGADKVENTTPASNDKPLAICMFKKGEEFVGSVTLACNPDLDVTTIERERAAMTKVQDIPAGIARGGYHISNAFFFNDDETPCRFNANWVNAPTGDALAEAMRTLTAAVTPATLK